jgi:hypothetical protein
VSGIWLNTCGAVWVGLAKNWEQTDMYRAGGKKEEYDYRGSENGAKANFFQQWGSLLILGVIITSALLGFRFWTDFQASEPVFAGYQTYIDGLASRSTSAKRYQDEYHAKFERKNIATKHYEQVCAVMTRLAQTQGAVPEQISLEMADGCIQFGKFYIEDDLPS